MYELRLGKSSVAALAGILAVGCAASPTITASPSHGATVTPAGTSGAAIPDRAQCSPSAKLTWTDDPLPDGEQFGWVRHFDGHAIYIDPAEFYSNDEANDAARDDGEIGKNEELPNPFYIRDPEADVVRVEVADGFTLRVIDGAAYPDERTLSRVTLANLYCPDADTAWMYSSPDQLPVHLNISGGLARSATEQYVP